jgi:hypothetical protein
MSEMLLIYWAAACVVRLPNSNFSIIHTFYYQKNIFFESAILKIYLQKIESSKYSFNHDEFRNSCALAGNELSGSGVGTRIGPGQYAADVITLRRIVDNRSNPSKPLVLAPTRCHEPGTKLIVQTKIECHILTLCGQPHDNVLLFNLP